MAIGDVGADRNTEIALAQALGVGTGLEHADHAAVAEHDLALSALPADIDRIPRDGVGEVALPAAVQRLDQAVITRQLELEGLEPERVVGDAALGAIGWMRSLALGGERALVENPGFGLQHRSSSSHVHCGARHWRVWSSEHTRQNALVFSSW